MRGHEALRLADLEGMNQEESAQYMGISRHTFGRILAEARRVVAKAVIKGLALRIHGGDYMVTGCRFAVVGRGPECEPRAVFESMIANQVQPVGREYSMSKIAVTSEGPGLDDQVDPRFGRAAGFVVVNLETMETHYIDNGQSQVMAQGAGIQAAELIARSGASWLLTGYVGPKAFQALSAAGIKIGQNLEGMTVREAVARFQSGSLQVADSSNREAGK
jgi:predicted Fe-Mo cluster-binding NifX family protein